MGVHSLCQSFLFLSLILFGSVNLCSADDKTFEVVGTTECADCSQNNFKSSQAFSGLRVTIDCKLESGDVKRFGSGEVDEQGKFKVSLSQKLNNKCYAQLHSAAALPCPAHNDIEASKIVLKSQTNGKTTFAPAKTLQFSATLCSSKTFLPYWKHPPHPWFKPLPKPTLPPYTHPWFHKPTPSPVPVYTPTPKPPVVEPLPPPAPVYTPTPKPPVYKPKPKPPVYKPKPKPPVYKPKPKPKPPVYKPKPEPPVVKKPCPPTVVKPLPPPVPVYKPPVKKPCPPVVVKPLPPPVPITKKPCPPLPKIPPKYFHHPKFGHFPPLPPSIPHHP
ncbi:proline-rich protein 4-like [Salvia splendens]|uniref:proline-rich protein 4-like n=1 Tax=Salvia splendens TaxID=180675 RepID=UPI001C277FE7|nr:proline-rich protein 4-like [Salvia splendens]